MTLILYVPRQNKDTARKKQAKHPAAMMQQLIEFQSGKNSHSASTMSLGNTKGG
jgi:hypothetical protein